jgi:hypothetical protein
MNQVVILCRRFELRLNSIALQARSNSRRAWALRKQLQNEDNSFIRAVAKAVGYATEGPENWRTNFLREGMSTRLSPNEKAEVLRIRGRVVSMAKELVTRAESHLATLCDEYEDELLSGNLELDVSRTDTNPEAVWLRYNRFEDITNAFLANFAEAVDDENQQEPFWRNALWKRGVPRQFSAELRTSVPALGVRASRIKDGLEARARELLPSYVDRLCDTYQRELKNISHKISAVQHPDLASLLQLREIKREVDVSADAFMASLAKALNYSTSGRKSVWQWNLLSNEGLRIHIPDQLRRILSLRQESTSIRAELDKRSRKLLRPHVDALCDRCERAFGEIPPKITVIRQTSLASLLELRQLESEVEASIDTVFEELAKAIQYKTEGFKSEWQKKVLYDGVPNHVPDRQERILELKTRAFSIKSDLGKRAGESLRPYVDSRCDTCQQELSEAQEALIGIQQPSLASLEELRQLKNKVDSIIDTFLYDLATALNRTTSRTRSRWQPPLLNDAVPKQLPDQQDRIFALKANAVSIQGELDKRFSKLLRLYVDTTLLDTCQRNLDVILQELVAIQQPPLSSFERLRTLQKEVDVTIDGLLESLAKALRYKSEGRKFEWQKRVLEAAVPKHLPDRQERILGLRANAASIRTELEERLRELLSFHVENLCKNSQRGLSDIKPALAAIEQPSLASLRTLRQLGNDTDAIIDAFFENLAKALKRPARPDKLNWQSELLANVAGIIPDEEERVVVLKTDASSIKNELNDRLSELLWQYVDGLCNICRLALDNVQQKLAALAMGSILDAEQSRRLSSEVDAIMDTFLEDLANGLNRKTAGSKAVWHRNLLHDAVRRYLPPDQQARVFELKTGAFSIKNDLSNRNRKLPENEPVVRPNGTSGPKKRGQPDIRNYRDARLGAGPFQCRTIDGRNGTGRKLS